MNFIGKEKGKGREGLKIVTKIKQKGVNDKTESTKHLKVKQKNYLGKKNYKKVEKNNLEDLTESEGERTAPQICFPVGITMASGKLIASEQQ